MINSTEQYLDVDGVSLQTFAWNIKSWGGSREGVPPLRGEDRKIPRLPGTSWLPKVPDSRTYTISGWVIGADRYGDVVDQEEFRANWRRLRSLLWNPDRQIVVTKRWMDGPNPMVASALAEYDAGLAPEMTGPMRADFTVDLFLADPFFYGPEEEVEIVRSSAGPKTVSTEVRGDATTRKVTVEFDGPLTNGRVENVGQGAWVQYSSLAGSATAVLDGERFTARETVGSTTTKTLGKVTNGGSDEWLPMPRGTTDLKLTSTAGAGGVVVKYRPAYL